MARDINLLPQRKLDLLQQERTVVIVRGVALVVMILVVTSALAIFLLNKNTSLDSLKAQQQSLRANFSLLHDKTAKNYLLVDRVTKIAAITKKKSTFIGNITTIEQLVPPDVSIDTFTINKTNVSMNVSSSSLISLGKYMDGLNKLVGNKGFFKKITIDNAIADEKAGKFIVSMKGDLL